MAGRRDSYGNAGTRGRRRMDRGSVLCLHIIVMVSGEFFQFQLHSSRRRLLILTLQDLHYPLLYMWYVVKSACIILIYRYLPMRNSDLTLLFGGEMLYFHVFSKLQGCHDGLVLYAYEGHWRNPNPVMSWELSSFEKREKEGPQAGRLEGRWSACSSVWI